METGEELSLVHSDAFDDPLTAGVSPALFDEIGQGAGEGALGTPCTLLAPFFCFERPDAFIDRGERRLEPLSFLVVGRREGEEVRVSEEVRPADLVLLRNVLVRAVEIGDDTVRIVEVFRKHPFAPGIGNKVAHGRHGGSIEVPAPALLAEDVPAGLVGIHDVGVADATTSAWRMASTIVSCVGPSSVAAVCRISESSPTERRRWWEGRETLHDGVVGCLVAVVLAEDVEHRRETDAHAGQCIGDQCVHEGLAGTAVVAVDRVLDDPFRGKDDVLNVPNVRLLGSRHRTAAPGTGSERSFRSVTSRGAGSGRV